MHRSFIISIICCGIVMHAQSQNNDVLKNDDLELVRSTFHKEKRELIREYMNLPGKDSSKFWEIYNEYEASRKTLGSNRLQIISDYAKHYETLDNPTAESLANRVFENDLSLIKLHQKYFKKLIPVIGAKNAAKFLQLEMFIQESIRTDIQTSIPFIDELKSEKTSK